MNKKEERIIDPYSNYRQENYLNNSIREELKSLQKSIAIQQQTLNKIVNMLESFKAIKILGGI